MLDFIFNISFGSTTYYFMSVERETRLELAITCSQGTTYKRWELLTPFRDWIILGLGYGVKLQFISGCATVGHGVLRSLSAKCRQTVKPSALLNNSMKCSVEPRKVACISGEIEHPGLGCLSKVARNLDLLSG